MTKVGFDISISLDGFMTAANQTPDEPMGPGGLRLVDWAFAGDEQDSKIIPEGVAETGAVIAGRRTYDYHVLPLDPRVQELQEAYVRKVVDTLHDLENVLWEVANESSGGGNVEPAFMKALGLADIPEWGDSTSWQYWVIDTVKRYEEEMGYEPHPIGMTMQFPVHEQMRVNEPLFASRAEWISPGYDDEP